MLPNLYFPVRGAADPGFVLRGDAATAFTNFAFFYNFLPSADGREDRQSIILKIDITAIETTAAAVQISFRKMVLSSVDEGTYVVGSSLDIALPTEPLLQLSGTTPTGIISETTMFTKIIASGSPTLFTFTPAMKYRILDVNAGTFPALKINFASLGAGDLAFVNSTLSFNEFET